MISLVLICFQSANPNGPLRGYIYIYLYLELTSNPLANKQKKNLYQLNPLKQNKNFLGGSLYFLVFVCNKKCFQCLYNFGGLDLGQTIQKRVYEVA